MIKGMAETLLGMPEGLLCFLFFTYLPIFVLNLPGCRKDKSPAVHETDHRPSQLKRPGDAGNHDKCYWSAEL